MAISHRENGNMKINFNKKELMLLLETVKDYRWVGDFSNNELEKMKRKLKYNINKCMNGVNAHED